VHKKMIDMFSFSFKINIQRCVKGKHLNCLIIITSHAMIKHRIYQLS